MPKDTASKPLVSIIIPAYNCAGYLLEAVESALSQTEPSPEVIIVDDGSSDETHMVLSPYMDRIRYVYQENQGISVARNHGLKLSQGKYIVFLDADDFLLPGKLAEQVTCMAADLSLGAIHSGWCLVDERGEKLREVEPWHEIPRLDLKTWLLYNPAFLGAMLFHHKWLECVGGFDVELKRSEDTDLLLRLALAGCRMAWLPKITACYRQHGSSITRDSQLAENYAEKVLDKFFGQPEVPEDIRRLENSARFYRLIWVAGSLYCTGRTDMFIKYLQRSLEYTPYALDQTVIEWIEGLTQQLLDEGSQADEARVIMPLLTKMAYSSDMRWLMAERNLRWWVDVWRHYLDDNEWRMGELSAYRGLGAPKLTEMAKSSLLMTPAHRMVNVIARFWEDMRGMGFVSSSQGYKVTGLYLTAFGQASMAREWTAARHALLQAVRSSAHPRALGPWIRFVRSAFIYFLESFKGQH